mgnify:CR=1 FL=1
MTLNIGNFKTGNGNSAKTPSNPVATTLPSGLIKPENISDKDWLAILRQKYAIKQSVLNRQERTIEQFEPTGYGLLYNAHAYSYPDLAPLNCRIPTLEDWQILANHLGGAEKAAFFLKGLRMQPLPAPSWESPLTASKNNNDFFAYGAGKHGYLGFTQYLHQRAYFATSTPILVDDEIVDWVCVRIDHDNMEMQFIDFPEVPSRVRHGISVRCIVDENSAKYKNWSPGETIRDNDGNIYGTVKIGNQIWLASNLAVRQYRNGNSIPFVENAGDFWDIDEHASAAPNYNPSLIGRTSQL